ncbi:hypothetical protein [Variovorax sp. SRS16]|uniref:hypothetical protein n=1 Tax=Variovorax sp. SRS16 TaxID=282217 RepID=UPI0013A57CB9|nr:hypothetical protein [Variovorax sp. SRS16]
MTSIKAAVCGDPLEHPSPRSLGASAQVARVHESLMRVKARDPGTAHDSLIKGKNHMNADHRIAFRRSHRGAVLRIVVASLATALTLLWLGLRALVIWVTQD